jgi:hypothetical protein
MPEPTTLYDVQGLGPPYNIRMAERCGAPELLPARIALQVARLQDKIVTGVPVRGWITHLCETAALVVLGEKLEEWEEVRLSLLDAEMKEVPGHIYGKVTRMQPAADNLFEAAVGFTSVSPEVYRIIQEAVPGA